jgi:uncharacterized membrane protein YkgB
MRIGPDLPLRLSSAAFLVWVGSRKVQRPREHTDLLELASHSAPFLQRAFAAHPELFARVLGSTEVSLGLWLASGIARRAAGVALTAFSLTTFSLVYTVPGNRVEGSWWEPSPQGLSISKDVWMLGIGLALALGEESKG